MPLTVPWPQVEVTLLDPMLCEPLRTTREKIGSDTPYASVCVCVWGGGGSGRLSETLNAVRSY